MWWFGEVQVAALYKLLLLVMLQEFAPGGDLFEALKHQPGMVYGEQHAVGCLLAPCLEALAYLHDRVSMKLE